MNNDDVILLAAKQRSHVASKTTEAQGYLLVSVPQMDWKPNWHAISNTSVITPAP